jgi:RND family efflux transporter MFP subunit
MSVRIAAPVALLAAVIALVGCSRKPPTPAPTTAPSVIVSRPVIQRVQDYEDFAGRTEPFKEVQLKSRVTGNLKNIHFNDGQDIEQGKPLFDIDDRLYKAELGKAHAALSKAQKHLRTATENYIRVKAAYEIGAEGKETYDLRLGEKLEAEHDVELTNAAVDMAETNYRFCRIYAPFDGRLSKRMVDEENLIKADETLLTTIVRLDQVYATFDIDERTVSRILRLIEKDALSQTGLGELSSSGVKPLIAWLKGSTVMIALADDDDFTLTGTVTFVDNQIDAGTGTLRVRATVVNPKLNRPPYYMLSPGQFVRVRVPIGSQREAVLVPEKAFGSDQGQRYVYVVRYEKGDSGPQIVERRNVRTGQQYGQSRVVEDGAVTPADRIVVEGLLRVRPGGEVNPKEFEPPKPKPAPTAPAVAPAPLPAAPAPHDKK